MDKETKKIKPFDAFSYVNKWLMAAGFSKLLNPRNKWTEKCHKVYRLLVIPFVYLNAIQHIIYTVQVREDTERLVESIILSIPLLLLSFKVTTLYLSTDRIDKLIELLNDPIFAARNEENEKCMERNKKAMHRLSKAVIYGLPGVAFFWTMAPVFKRIQNPTNSLPLYVPYKTDTWPKFIIADIFDTIGVILWMGFGHLSIDVVIATYYSQAWVQLQIINYNLEHLFDVNNEQRRNGRFQFIDVLGDGVKERFVYYIKRYNKVHWFINEVTSIFNPAVSLQFFMTAFSSCLVTFQMSSTDIFSATFGFSFGYYLCTQGQIFFYCYYGGLIEHESRIMADSLYLSEWQTLSPKFRKLLLIAMSRWIRPITPTVLGLVPLSLSTFVSITRSAYSLFTVLKSKNSKTE